MNAPFAAHEDDIDSPGIQERMFGGGGADHPAGDLGAVAACGGSPASTGNELVFTPAVARLDEVDRLADPVL
jgi:hypothetical protein